MSVPCTITQNSISILLDGRMRVISSSQKSFAKVEKLLKRLNGPKGVFESDKSHEKRLNKLRELIDIPVYLEKMTEGRVKVTDKGVMFNGQPIHNVIAEQIMKMLDQGHDVRPLAKFLDKVMDNPNPEIAAELYQWISSSQHFSIAPDGDFLAYKKIASDYSSIHPAPDGTKMYNSLGTTVAMPREHVDADRTRTCSTGLHFCSFDYLEHYGWGGEDRVVIVKVNPMDVVSIPDDYDYTKGRACRYEIWAEVPRDELSPDIFKAAVQYVDEDFRLMEYDTNETWSDEEEEDEVYDDYHWRDEEKFEPWVTFQNDSELLSDTVTIGFEPEEVEAKRTIPVVDRDGKVIRYIEE